MGAILIQIEQWVMKGCVAVERDANYDGPVELKIEADHNCHVNLGKEAGHDGTLYLEKEAGHDCPVDLERKAGHVDPVDLEAETGHDGPVYLLLEVPDCVVQQDLPVQVTTLPPHLPLLDHGQPKEVAGVCLVILPALVSLLTLPVAVFVTVLFEVAGEDLPHYPQTSPVGTQGLTKLIVDLSPAP